jgi:hypothetical protein
MHAAGGKYLEISGEYAGQALSERCCNNHFCLVGSGLRGIGVADIRFAPGSQFLAAGGELS